MRREREKTGKSRSTRTYHLRGKTIFQILCLFMFMSLSADNTWGALPNTLMDYRDYDETVDILNDLSDAHPGLVTLKTIGDSCDYRGVQVDCHSIYAMRVGPVGEQDIQDSGDSIPSILFVGGIHAREWLASESLLRLAEYLVERAQDPGTPEYALLRRVAVWIIPIANPAGRLIDDQDSGDPEMFFKGDGNTDDGWRHSADTRGCEAGSDIARNFSTGWGTASDSGCGCDADGCGWNSHFEGIAPFSNSEATALREFVQNHWICMAVDVHTCAQLIWNTWGTTDLAGVKMKQRAVEYWDRGLSTLAEQIYDPPAPGSSWWRRFYWLLTKMNFVDAFTLDDNDPKGTGGGQFTAWLQENQHVPSFLIELPPNNLRPDTDYYNSELRYRSDDASNAFHPSSSRVAHLIRRSFIPVATYLIGQANAPGSATQVGTVFDDGSAHAVDLSEPRGSYARDYGILAAKIGTGVPGAPGQIISYPAALSYGGGAWHEDWPAYNWLDPNHSYELYYWVQNYSRRSLHEPSLGLFLRGVMVDLELKSRPFDSVDSDPWTVDASASRLYRLGKREKTLGSFLFDLEPHKDYELTVKVRRNLRWGFWRSHRTDQFSNNNGKVFKFTTHSGGVIH